MSLFAILTTVIVGASIIVGVSSRFIFKKGDHPIEELAEEIVKHKTGIDVDFSPGTPEEEISDNDYIDMLMESEGIDFSPMSEEEIRHAEDLKIVDKAQVKGKK